MWQKFLDAIAQVATLTRDTKENREDIKKLREDFNKMTILMERVLAELRQGREMERSEREKLALKLENDFLRFKDQMRDLKALPPPGERPGDQGSKD
jgi:predicted  nucleic acid-binding Zn-ribbon protein